ncbi:M48 family metalloprotease [Streptomyces sp. NPDC001380]|uniref:M48 family metallopeptidase n=1 Tax=Streptomyces sp. NPDC001380 TaxID=3364566 RepID=UPI0036BFF759
MSRAEAPRLHALADRVAAALQEPPVHLVRVTPEFNASYGRVGLRRRGVLTIGLALWEVLTPQERIALLGHEFGHAVNGDARRGLWLHSAVVTLGHWYETTRPVRTPAGRSDALLQLGEGIAGLLMLVPHTLAGLLLRLLDRLTLRTGQHAEYLADDLAARVGSSTATRSMLEALVLHDSVEALFRRQAAVRRTGAASRTLPGAADDSGLWDELREYIASVPGTERTRRIRVSALRMGSVDSTHPPTHLRIRLCEARGPREAALTADAAETAAVEAELAPLRARAARAVFSSGRW